MPHPTEIVAKSLLEDINRLEAINAALVEALERVLDWVTSYPGEGALGDTGPYKQARKALAKATGCAWCDWPTKENSPDRP